MHPNKMHKIVKAELSVGSGKSGISKSGSMGLSNLVSVLMDKCDFRASQNGCSFLSLLFFVIK